MGDVDSYLAGLTSGDERTELRRLHRLISRHVPDVGQRTSYTMPCYTYRGVPVVAVMVRKKHIAWYPFSGTVLPRLAERLADYSHVRAPCASRPRPRRTTTCSRNCSIFGCARSTSGPRP